MLYFRLVLSCLYFADVQSLQLTSAPSASYDRLSTVSLKRASDANTVALTDLWRKDLAFGVGGERAVICFLRHFG